MTWLVDRQKTQIELANEFRRLMLADPILRIVGTHDGMSALIAENIGFNALYLSGAAYTASRGLPDLGISHSQEVAEKAREIIRAADLPLLVDIDTGFGGTINVARAAKEMVEVNVAAVQIEDQELPKKCGHLNGKRLVTPEEMVLKIKMIKEVTPSLVVIARTDANTVEGLEQAIERAKKYVDAGADAIFPEALTTEDEFRSFSTEIKVPLLANMTEFGKTPYIRAAEFESYGYSMVIYPVTSLRVAAKAYEKVFTEIFNEGTQMNSLHLMQTRKELYDIIKLHDYESLDNKIAKTIIP